MSDIIIMKFPPFFNRKQINTINTIKPDILILDDDFVAELKDFVLPDSIFYINFGKKFNKSLKFVTLPKYLKKIKFGDRYTQSLDHVSLPETIEIIEFGENFNNTLFTTKLPKNLKELILNNIFNASLPSILPEGLYKIFFGKEFDFSRNNFVIPQQLKYIHINGKIENKVLFENLPKTIEHIEIIDCLFFKYNFNFPLLETLIIPNNTKKIKINTKECKKLKYVKCCGKNINTKFLNNLPESVTNLEIIKNLYINLVNLPDNLEELFINIEPKIFHPIPRGIMPVPYPFSPLTYHTEEYPEDFVEQTNIPVTLKTLKLYDIRLLKFFNKLPIGCNIVDLNNEPYCM